MRGRRTKLLRTQRLFGSLLARSLLHWHASHGTAGFGAHSRLPRRGVGLSAPVRSVVAAVLIFATLLGSVQKAASAPENQVPGEFAPNSVRMDVRAGFDGAGRVGGWIPLDIQLANEGGEV